MEIIPNGDKFWAKVAKSDGCWLWTGNIHYRGYGRHFVKGRIVLAHRAAYILTYGPIPEGLYVCHKCDVRGCVRPDHLFLGTYKDNLHDASEKGRMQHGANHYAAKLTDEMVRAIRIALDAGDNNAVIGRRFGVSKQTIRAISIGKTWRHVI